MGSVYLPGTSGIKGSYFSSLFLVFSLSLSGFHLLVWMSPMPSSLQCFSFKLTFFPKIPTDPLWTAKLQAEKLNVKLSKRSLAKSKLQLRLHNLQSLCMGGCARVSEQSRFHVGGWAKGCRVEWDDNNKFIHFSTWWLHYQSCLLMMCLSNIPQSPCSS